MNCMKKILLLVCSVLLLSDSCTFDKFYFIRIQNNSHTTIKVCGAYILPDTLLPKEKLATTTILPGKSNTILDYRLNDYQLKRFENEKVTLFVIDEQIFQKVPWDTIRKHNMILKRYEIDSQDLKNLSKAIGGAWALPYP